MKINVDIIIRDSRWNDALKDIQSHIESVIRMVLQQYLKGFSTTEVSIVLSDDTFIQELNLNYRGKDSPTNVLSFPLTTHEDLENPSLPFCALGDIIIAYETMNREAQEQNKELLHHFTHMLVHGCLHLLHHDHQSEKDAAIMENLEIENLKSLNIKNPYEIIKN